MEETNKQKQTAMDSSNIICRFCNISGDNLIEIFPYSGENVNAFTKFMVKATWDCYNVKMEENDGLSSKVCEGCVETLQVFNAARQYVRCNDSIQREAISFSQPPKAVPSPTSSEIKEMKKRKKEKKKRKHRLVKERKQLELQNNSVETNEVDEKLEMTSASTSQPLVLSEKRPSRSKRHSRESSHTDSSDVKVLFSPKPPKKGKRSSDAASEETIPVVETKEVTSPSSSVNPQITPDPFEFNEDSQPSQTDFPEKLEEPVEIVKTRGRPKKVRPGRPKKIQEPEQELTDKVVIIKKRGRPKKLRTIRTLGDLQTELNKNSQPSFKPKMLKRRNGRLVNLKVLSLAKQRLASRKQENDENKEQPESVVEESLEEVRTTASKINEDDPVVDEQVVSEENADEQAGIKSNSEVPITVSTRGRILKPNERFLD